MRASEPAVVLRGGLSVPLPALQALWDLEARGFRVQVDGHELVVFPGSQLTPSDRAAIRVHRDLLIELVRYCEAVQ